MQFVLRIEKKSFQLPKKREKKSKLNSHVRELRVHSLTIVPSDFCSRLRAILGRRDWEI